MCYCSSQKVLGRVLRTFDELSPKDERRMAETTETLAIELGKSERQVLNYKKAVEKHLGFPITTQQGKQHFYKPDYVHLVRAYAKGEPLPEVVRQVEVMPPPRITQIQDGAGQGGEIILATRTLTAPSPLEVHPLRLIDVNTQAVETATDLNQTCLQTFQDQVRAQVLGEARAFGEELKAEVKQTVTRATAEAYQELVS
jgi:hypothetical protein